VNIVKCGDARILIKEIVDDTVSAIYFDPPFKTGRTFKLDPTSDIGFDDIFENDRDYIDLIEPIIIASKRVLKNDGSFFFHISAAEMFIPEALCRKHFRLVQPIFWKRSRSKNNVKNKLGAVTDIIFWCSQSKKPKFNLVYQPLDAYYSENSYKNKDERGNYALGHIVYGKTQKSKNQSRYYEFNIENRAWNPQYGWRVEREELQRLFDSGRIHIPLKRGNLYRKIYKHESRGKPATDIWDDIHSIAMGKEERKYPTQKPVSLLERIINMSTDPGDIVLDPMCGSGTTGIAAKKLGRKYILFDNNKDAVDITEQNLNPPS
jgi:DNA modification methylase